MTITDNAQLKTSELMDLLRKEVGVSSSWSNEELNKNFPVPKEATTRHFKDSREPDTLGKSWDDMQGTPIMTLREYILAQLQWKKEKGRWMDEKGWTVFADRLPCGSVAGGHWCPGDSQVGFDWDVSDERRDRAGGREALPSPTSPLVPSLPLELNINGVIYKKQ